MERPEDTRLPLVPSLGYGIQHILAMFGGGAAGLSGPDKALLVSSALFVSGLATVLQTLGVPWFGTKLPLVQGISFASVSTMLAIIVEGGTGAAGMQRVFGAVIAAGLLGLLIAPFFSRIVRFFPAVVTGSIITVIGLSLMPVAAGWIIGNVPTAADYASPSNIALAGFTLLVVLVLSKIQRLSRLAILLGLVIGTIAAFVVGMASTAGLSSASVVALPSPFHFGAPTSAV